MIYGLLKAAHLLAVIIWIGGMVFSRYCLGPATAGLDGPARASVNRDALGRFFRLVAAAVIVALVSGAWMTGRLARASVAAGSEFALPPGWGPMMGLGLAMTGLFLLIRFGLYPRLDRQVNDGDWSGAAASLAGLRRWVGVNLVLGLSVVIIMGLGPYLH